MANETPTIDHPETPARHTRFTILVTDDDKRNRETLSGLLSDRGFELLQAGCGEEAIEIARVEVIHVVFFDMHMPRMTGLEALQQVRLFHELLPAILMTADASRDVIRQALQAHVYSVLPKPLNTALVFHTLERALQTVYGESPTPPQPE